MSNEQYCLGRFGDRRLDKGGGASRKHRRAPRHACGEPRTGSARRPCAMPVLANDKVTLEALLAGSSEQTRFAAAGLHVLAIQDTSEINFKTTPERRRGLGEIGKGGGRGVLLHAMLALDADSDACLGLVAGEVWTRPGRVTVLHAKRPLEERVSRRWLSTAERAKEVLKAAACVTVIDDREGDIYANGLRLRRRTFIF